MILVECGVGSSVEQLRSQWGEVYGLTGVRVDRFVEEEGRVVVEAMPTESRGICPACGRASDRVHGRYVRELRDLLACGRPVRVRAAAGRLVLLYLPTYSPWLNPIEMLWRHFRREVTHCELFGTMAALLAAATEFFARYNREPWKILTVIGAKPAILV